MLRPAAFLGGIAAIGALLAAPPAPATPAPVPAPAPGDGSSDASGAVATAAFFPVDAARALVYRKTTERSFGRASVETLDRRPVPERTVAMVDALRYDDSEGEYMVLGTRDGAPAMGGQSMRAQGFEQTYDPPIVLFPSEARVGEARTFSSTVRHRTARGVREGAIARTVTLEGVEAVETPAGRFEGCLRFSAVTENRPEKDGAFLARTVETVWLAAGVGEVKSVSRVTLSTFGIPWLAATITLELAGGPLAGAGRAEEF
jgi:hypothetical protein